MQELNPLESFKKLKSDINQLWIKLTFITGTWKTKQTPYSDYRIPAMLILKHKTHKQHDKMCNSYMLLCHKQYQRVSRNNQNPYPKHALTKEFHNNWTMQY